MFRPVRHFDPTPLEHNHNIMLMSCSRPQFYVDYVLGRRRMSLQVLNTCSESCGHEKKRGHRPDVCPNPTTRCPRCGIANPIEGHPCEPKCVVCGAAPLTGSTAYPLHFKPHRSNRSPPEQTKDEKKKGNTLPNSQNQQEWAALPKRGRSRTKTPIQ